MSKKSDEIYLGEAEFEPVPNPIDPDYALRVAAADRLKIQPDQREIPLGVSVNDFNAADVVSEITNAEFEKAVDKEVRAMKKDGSADEVPVPESAPSEGVA